VRWKVFFRSSAENRIDWNAFETINFEAQEFADDELAGVEGQARRRKERRERFNVYTGLTFILGKEL
jgi:hypothetical protein